MKTSTEFKQALRAGKLSEAFLLAMSNAPELHITTWIAPANEDSLHQSEHSSKPQAGNFLRTHINLIEGKIDNEIGEKLIGDGNPAIQKFHLQQVTQGSQTIQQNLQSLQKMFHLMSAFEQQRQTGNTQLNWVNVESDALAAPADTVELEGNKAIGSLSAAESNTISTDNKSYASESDKVESEQWESSSESAKVEPQLPSFTQEEDGIVDDLLSLADLDDESDGKQDNDEDWGEWLEDDEANVKPEIIDLNSLDPNPQQL